MKIKFLFFLILIISSFASKAQHYYPLPDSNVAWITQQSNGLGGWDYFEFFTDSVNADTIINSKKYAKIFFKNNGSWIEYGGAYRSDTLGYSYLVPQDSTNEYIIRDLTKSEGDTVKNILYGLPLFFSNGFSLINLYIDSVDYVQAGPYYLKRMYLSNKTLFPNVYSSLVWVEKIGASSYVTFNIINDGMRVDLLKCMHYNDTIYYYYQYPPVYYMGDPVYIFGQCDIHSFINNLDQNIQTISFSPNPFSDKITISNLRNEAICQLNIYNSVGQLICKKENIKPYENTLSLNMKYLKPGLYFFSLISANNTYCKKIIKE